MKKRLNNHCECITLVPPGVKHVTPLNKLQFTARLMSGQMLNQIDWLLFDHIGPATSQMFVPRPFRRPYGLFIHSIEVWNDLSPIRLRTLREATIRIANSSYTAERTNAAHPGLGPTVVCPLALAPDALQEQTIEAADQRVLGQLQPQSVLIVGRINSAERHKGHFQLIDAWPEVIRQVPDAQLVIVGRGDDLELLRTKARDLGCEASMFFTGWVSDATLAAIYQKVAAYAMPSNGEGFGLVFLEAMKYRLPCIASSTDASREVVVDNSTGFLVDQTDQAQLINRLVRLLTDPGLRRRLGEAGFQRLHQHFTFAQFEQHLMRALAPLQKLSGTNGSGH